MCIMFDRAKTVMNEMVFIKKICVYAKEHLPPQNTRAVDATAWEWIDSLKTDMGRIRTKNKFFTEFRSNFVSFSLHFHFVFYSFHRFPKRFLMFSRLLFFLSFFPLLLKKYQKNFMSMLNGNNATYTTLSINHVGSKLNFVWIFLLLFSCPCLTFFVVFFKFKWVLNTLL